MDNEIKNWFHVKRSKARWLFIETKAGYWGLLYIAALGLAAYFLYFREIIEKYGN